MTDNQAWRNRIVNQGTKPASQFMANPLNWRKHPMNQRAALKGVLDEVGWVQNVIENVRTGNLIDGHERIFNALQNGDQDVPYVQVDLSEAEEALILATLDPIGAMAQTDAVQLDAVLREVETGDAALQELLAGLAEDAGLYLDDKKANDPGAQIDKAEELREKWQTETGQLWQLGEHRLICGDCTDAAVVERVMGGEKAMLLVTSPPYWVGKAYETQKSEADIDKFIRDCVRAWTDFVGVDYARIVINTGTAAIHRIEKRRKVEVLPLIDKWQEELRQRGWLARHFRIWAKSGDFPASISPRTDVVDQHWEHLVTFENEAFEYIGTFWPPTGKHRGQQKIGTKWAQQGVWADIQGDKSSGGTHVAAFPVELPTRNIMLYTDAKETVLDPFSGSGTTLIACEQLGRKCRAVEISAAYTAVAIQRWVDMTGGEPVLVVS